MRKLLIISMFYLIGCTTTKKTSQLNSELNGVYVLKSDKLFQAFSDLNYHSFELKSDGTYILKKAEIKFATVIEQCEIASKGKWTTVSNDVLELTSEEKYEKQKGFEYELKKENKFSQDSLYIQLNFPADFELPVNLRFGFNHQKEKILESGTIFFALPKSKYLLPKTTNSINRNHISFSLNANISGTNLYKSRILFDIFEEDIDTEKTNYLTISLPNFDKCFFDFEPFNKELIYIKDEKELIWQGESWKKID